MAIEALICEEGSDFGFEPVGLLQALRRSALAQESRARWNHQCENR